MAPRARSRSPYRGAHEGVAGQLPLADLLLQRGILDDGSVDFLKKVPLEVATEVLLSLGPEVRNPSAFVTRQLTSKVGAPPKREAPSREAAAPAASALGEDSDIVMLTFQGVQNELYWITKEDSIIALVEWGMLDEGSADFLSKAPEEEAKKIVFSMGGSSEVRNPSAFVTRKCKELQNHGVMRASDAAPVIGTEDVLLQIFHNGEPIELVWSSREQAVAELIGYGILDESSADYLAKVDEAEAKNIVAALTADVRNPSAFVTRKIKALLGSAGGKAAGGKAAGGKAAGGKGDGKQSSWGQGEMMEISFHGQPFNFKWTNATDALATLVEQGILDEVSADYLTKVPEPVAREIIAGIGPDTRNPSAYVTRQVKTRQSQSGGGKGAAPAASQQWGGQQSHGGRSSVTISFNGQPMQVDWKSREAALMFLVSKHVLDDRSADFLTKVSENVAKEIVSSLGPEVRNPSAFVTKEVKKRMSYD